MQLSYFTVQNYRSITDAYKLNMSELTVLLGKNNKGKTNIIRAIILGMRVLHYLMMKLLVFRVLQAHGLMGMYRFILR